MPEPLIDDDQEPYASSEDSDFAPDTGAAADDSGSESEKGDTQPAAVVKTKASKAPKADDGEDVGYDNSGDEAIIKKGAKKRRKARADEDEEGGEGGLIKTRRQRAAEKEERKIAAAKGPVTIDVDSVWAQMLAGQTTVARQPDDAPATADGEDADVPTSSPVQPGKTANLVRIKRTYNFAGRVHTEEKVVTRDSAEAKLFVASGGQVEPVTADTDSNNNNNSNNPSSTSPRRTVARKAFRSSFEPQLDLSAQPRRADLDLGVAARMRAGREAQAARKLNTVEKSRMDWAGFVDREGIKDELELAGRSKDSYAARQDFLERSEMRREDDARRARMAGRA